MSVRRYTFIGRISSRRSWRRTPLIFVAAVMLAILTTCFLYNAAEHESNEYIPFPNSDGKNWREQVVEVPIVLYLMGVPHRAAILEIGTGRGVALLPIVMRRQPSHLVGLDISKEALEIAKKSIQDENLQSTQVVLSDARHMPFHDGAFDVMMDFGTLYHIANQSAALHEISRVIRPGGMIITETPFSQFVSHPFRSWGRKVPWHAVPCLKREAWWLLWEKRINTCTVTGAASEIGGDAQ